MIRTSHCLTIKILSPLFIGSGKSYFADEYFILKEGEKNMLHRFDSSDVFEVFSEAEIKAIAEIRAKPVEMRKKMNILLKTYFETGKIKSIYSVKVNKSTAETFYENIENEKQGSESNQLAVKEFIQNSFGKKYIPGSSIKGAIATAMQEMCPKIKAGFQGNYNDLMITDSEIFPDMTSFEVKKIERKGKEESIPADYELLTSGEIQCSFKLKNGGKFTTEEIVMACKKYAIQQIEYSLNIIEKRITKEKDEKKNSEQQKEKKEAYESLDVFFSQTIEDMKSSPDSFFLNLGFGGIALFKMFSEAKGGKYKWDVKTKDGFITVEDFPSTFWLIEENIPLGWVKCTFL